MVAVRVQCLIDAGLGRKLPHFRNVSAYWDDDVLVFDPERQAYGHDRDAFERCRVDVPPEVAQAVAGPAKPERKTVVAVSRPGFPAYNGYDGRRWWKELHEELHPSPDTVERVISRVCWMCRPRARALLKLHPIDFTSPDAYRRSTVIYHDAVNADVGNPTFGYEAAAKLYGW